MKNYIKVFDEYLVLFTTIRNNFSNSSIVRIIRPSLAAVNKVDNEDFI